jgi:AcrR family transcriptional regulator
MLDVLKFHVSSIDMESIDTDRRSYQQTARAVAAEDTRRRILQAFVKRLSSFWFDEITLDVIAQDADVTVQTVVRRFLSKEGLLQAAVAWMGQEVRINRKLASATPAAVAAVLAKDYEQNGDLIMRLLDQEGRYPALKHVCDIGRREHRKWLAEIFANDLVGSNAEPRLDSLVVATDLYTWKLLRRDMGRSVRTYRQIVETHIDAALAFERPDSK